MTEHLQVKEEPVERPTLFTCQLNFSQESTRDAHRQHYCHRTGQCSRASQIKPLDLSKPKRSTKHQRTFACDSCSIRFRSMKVLHAHQENYCREGQTKMRLCPSPSTRWCPYRRLMKCTICSAMFDLEETLFSHLRSVHANEDLIECLACRSRFCSLGNLLRHLRLSHTHLKDEKFSHVACPYCSIGFVSLGTLRQHMTHYCCSRPTIRVNEIEGR